MQNNSYIQNKTEAALNSIDDVQRATPKPFFYTRLMARLTAPKQNAWEKFSAFIARPAVAFVCVCFVIVMNVIIVFSNIHTSSPANDQTELASTEEYSQVSTSVIYDYENLKP